MTPPTVLPRLTPAVFHVSPAHLGRLGFVIWIFVETAIGIVREQVRQPIKGATKLMLANPRFSAAIRAPAIAGLLLILPFAIMEFMFNILNNPRALNAKGLIGLTVLFGLLWLLPTVFMAILLPMVRIVRAGTVTFANPVFLVLRVVALLILAWVWGALIIDQLPCFLGVPNCD